MITDPGIVCVNVSVCYLVIKRLLQGCIVACHLKECQITNHEVYSTTHIEVLEELTPYRITNNMITRKLVWTLDKKISFLILAYSSSHIINSDNALR